MMARSVAEGATRISLYGAPAGVASRPPSAKLSPVAREERGSAKSKELESVE